MGIGVKVWKKKKKFNVKKKIRKHKLSNENKIEYMLFCFEHNNFKNVPYWN